MKTLLVTGGAGFIGSNFIEHIFNKYSDYKIIVLDSLTYAGDIENINREIRESERFEFWYGNVNNLDLVSDLVKKSDIIVHFAAETHVARSLYSHREFFITDVLGTQSVVNAVVKYSEKIERFIHISTSEVYGTAVYEPMDENHPLNPTSPYAAAKAGADRLVSSYIIAYDIPAIILRPFNNYGPKQHLEKVVPRFITSCILGEKLTIHGDGSAERDWVHSSDTSNAIDLVIHAPIEKVKGKIFNIGTGESLSILQIARKVIKIFNLDETYFDYIPDRFGQVQKHIASYKKANDLFGFTPIIKFEDGLYNTIQWYTENKHIWQKQLPLRKVPIKSKDGTVFWY
ncbi:MAG: GDP-mannose 4,6-dehydratase [Nitrospirae bacterium]|jgi:dTDP-glucose 4,6-dehydratase|nr:GDP-mannose 4,6-dehydratase [Nitrospirota bacterium]